MQMLSAEQDEISVSFNDFINLKVMRQVRVKEQELVQVQQEQTKTREVHINNMMKDSSLLWLSLQFGFNCLQVKQDDNSGRRLFSDHLRRHRTRNPPPSPGAPPWVQQHHQQ